MTWNATYGNGQRLTSLFYKMPDITIKTAPEVKYEEPQVIEPKQNTHEKDLQHHYAEEPIEYAKIDDTVLNALGIDDIAHNMPDEDQANLREVSHYLTDIIKSRGLEQVSSSYTKVLNDLKFEMGLDKDAEPSVVLDRIGGVVRAWRDISFIKDAKEKKALFMKLAKQPDSKSMNKLIFTEMERRSVWQ